MKVRSEGSGLRRTGSFKGAPLALTAVSLLLGAPGCGRTSEPAQASESTATVSDALTSCVVMPEIGDATLANPPMDKNFGTVAILKVGKRGEALLQFDLSSLPVAASINSATLMLSIAGGDDQEDEGDDACDFDGAKGHHCPTIRVHRATSAWSEGTVTFASFAQHFDPAIAASLVVASGHSTKSVDITSLVTTWFTGARPNDGVLLETSSKRASIFVSREGGRPDQRPSLQVCYTTPDNHCAPNPCQNGAVCANNPTGYTCACPPGYSGTNCETLIDNCASNPCLNGGACTNSVGSYTCACAPGYTGTNCETLINNCATSPCQNGGTCTNGVNSYTCACAPGYTGTNCGTLINNCVANPCQNGGTCTNGVNSYTCACRTGFTGTNCEVNIDDCVGNGCQNGATCIDGINAYTCSCPPDWGGPLCNLNLNDCAQNPCLNGATCMNGVGNYTCSCLPGYTGTNCQVDINDCASSPCHNGGICVDGVNSYTCTCSNGFSGPNCDGAPVPTPVTVPSNPANLSSPHTVLSGVTTTLKGIVLYGATQFYWDFGDGSSTGWANIVDPYNLAVRHSYAGLPGQLFIATLQVRASAGSATYSATYPLQLADPSQTPDPRIPLCQRDVRHSPPDIFVPMGGEWSTERAEALSRSES